MAMLGPTEILLFLNNNLNNTFLFLQGPRPVSEALFAGYNLILIAT